MLASISTAFGLASLLSRARLTRTPNPTPRLCEKIAQYLRTLGNRDRPYAPVPRNAGSKSFRCNRSGPRWAACSREGVTSPGVVEPLDIGDDVAAGLGFGRVHGAVDAFVLQRREGDSAIALMSHRGPSSRAPSQVNVLSVLARDADLDVPAGDDSVKTHHIRCPKSPQQPKP